MIGQPRLLVDSEPEGIQPSIILEIEAAVRHVNNLHRNIRISASRATHLICPNEIVTTCKRRHYLPLDLPN